uniref:prolyl 3-hydroxylase 2-like n=1 Tax=Podarcis muralis TaxID=64176 RepID=UPI00109F16FF|nr:prolyl 3-hydroxylase 2-like [Podarcis muralis]
MEDYLLGVKHYDKEEYDAAIEFLERALRGYHVADTECRVLCEGSQKFEDYEYLDYKATLYEGIAGRELQSVSAATLKY